MSAVEQLGDRWSFQARLSPWSLLAATAALGAAMACGSRLDTPGDRAALAIVTTLSLVSASAEAVADLATATPERRWRRRVRGVAVVAGPALMAWLLTSVVTAAADASAPLPGRSELLAWVAMAATQVAVGAVVTAGGRRDGGLGPGLLVALGWALVLWMPRLSEWMSPIERHAGRWWAVAAAAVVVAAAAGRDPAMRPLRRTGRPPESPTW